MHKNYVAGEWVVSDDWIERLNPSNLDDVVGRYAVANDRLLDQAVEAAREAQKSWRLALPETRARILDSIADAIQGRKEEMAVLLSREEGKTLAEARGEINFAASVFKYFAGEAIRIGGKAGRSIRKGVDVEVLREPVGVVGLITPWNVPFLTPAWKIAPALAYGNSVILKPSEFTNGSAFNLATILDQSDLPKGVFHLLMGAGAGLGARLAAHPGLDGLSFTGSTATGRRIAAAIAPHKSLQMEMGGKNPLIIMNDADLDAAADAAWRGAFQASGQRCTASSKIIVHREAFEPFSERLIKLVNQTPVGDPLMPETAIGPVVNETQYQRVLSYVEAGRCEGVVLAGGRLPELKNRGHFVAPVLFGDISRESALNREEIFGPVATITPVSDFEEALMYANDTEFGLSASIYTASLKWAVEFKRRSTAGIVQVNMPTFGGDYHVPFGGNGISSSGARELGGAENFYTKTKTAYTAF